MNGSAATAAIARTRLHRETGTLAALSMVAAAASYLQRYDDPLAHLAGALVFGLIAAAAGSLTIASPRNRDLQLCEESAPLYGRELARARAIVPATAACCALAAYWIVASVYAAPAPWFFVTAVFAANAGGIAIMCATRTAGAVRVGYAIASVALAGAAFLLVSVPAAACVINAAAYYALLRQYGELLARN